MSDELEKQLARLPAEVIEENKASWGRVVSQIEESVALGKSKYCTAEKLTAIREIVALDESSLFRAAIVRVYLTISTAQKVGLEQGELFLRLIWNEETLPVIEYCRFGRKSIQAAYTCKRDTDLIPYLQPMLKRLWYETREKHPAES